MIVISTYNPDTKRTTQDEELLTTLLTSLIVHRVYSHSLAVNSKTEDQKVWNQVQTINCDRLIGLTFPLLGLDFAEVYELLKMEEERCRIDPIGKK